jgi:hypothetical protein
VSSDQRVAPSLVSRLRAKPLRLLVSAGLSFAVAALVGDIVAGQWRAQAAPTRPLSVAGAAPAAATPLYGITGPPPAGLVRVDPRVLRPLPGWRIPLEGHSFGWSFSADRSRLALGSDGSGEVRLLDLRHRRVVGDVEVNTTQGGSVLASAWAGPNRVLAVVVNPGCCGLGNTTVAAIDASRPPRLLWQRRLGGSLQAGERFRRSLVLVLGPPGRKLGRSRLVTVDPDGHVRAAALTEIRSGLGGSGDYRSGRFVSDIWNPGLAVDPAGARAFVVQAGAPVVEVDLRSLRVRYHSLAKPISLLGRLRDWLEPKAEAKADEGPTRQALWLGQGMLAVTGFDGHAGVDPRGGQAEWATPAGLKLIDTRTWGMRTLDPHVSKAVLASGTLLAFGVLWDSRSQKMTGSGLSGYNPDGSRRFHLYGDDPISAVQPLGARILVGGAAGSRLFRHGAVLDARTGRELERASFAVELLAGDEPCWY